MSEILRPPNNASDIEDMKRDTPEIELDVAHFSVGGARWFLLDQTPFGLLVRSLRENTTEAGDQDITTCDYFFPWPQVTYARFVRSWRTLRFPARGGAHVG